MRHSPTAWLSLLLCLGGCPSPVLDPPARCVAPTAAPTTTPTPEAVCARLNQLSCRLADCPGAYARYRARVAPEEFRRLASCYLAAADCDQVSQCEYACGPDGGPVRVSDAGAETDAAFDASADRPEAGQQRDDAVAPDDRPEVGLQRDDVVAPPVDAPAPVDAPDAAAPVDAPQPIDATAPDDVSDAAVDPDAVSADAD